MLCSLVCGTHLTRWALPNHLDPRSEGPHLLGVCAPISRRLLTSRSSVCAAGNLGEATAWAALPPWRAGPGAQVPCGGRPARSPRRSGQCPFLRRHCDEEESCSPSVTTTATRVHPTERKGRRSSCSLSTTKETGDTRKTTRELRPGGATASQGDACPAPPEAGGPGF